jgi:hypothetical protein
MVSPSFLHVVNPTNFRNLHNSDFDQIFKYMERLGLFADEKTPAENKYPVRKVPTLQGSQLETDREKQWIASGKGHYISDEPFEESMEEANIIVIDDD